VKRRILILHVALIIGVTGIAYSGSFAGQFVSDDITAIRDNPILRSLGWENLKTIFSTFDGANYMPLKVLSLAVDHSLWGSSTTGYHGTNWLLHVGCALLIYAILRRLGMQAIAALLAALLWAVHPLQVESVAWISERKNVLSGLFFFAAFYVYLSYSETGRSSTFLVVVALYGLALLSKMNTVVLPAVCLAYEATFRFRIRRQDVIASLPLFALGGLVVAYNLAGNPIHATGYHGGSAIVTWLSSATVVFRYLGAGIWPVDLRYGYHVPLRGSLLDPVVLLSLLGIAAIAASTFWMYRRRRPETFWVLWFWITLVPMLNIVPFRSLMQDRYMYLPLLGPLALAATSLGALRSDALRRGAAAAAILAIVGCGVLTHRQVEVWDNSLALWKAWALHEDHIFGDLRYVSREHPQKVAWLREVIAREPGLATAHNNLGSLYVQEDRNAKALRHFERAAELDAENAHILLNLGRAHAALGDYGSARPALERAAEIEPYHYVIRLNLARVYLRERDAPRARAQLEACARIKPHLVQRGRIRREQGELERLERERSNPLR
jgi:tetratricopeptide (TPR) repeat protein